MICFECRQFVAKGYAQIDSSRENKTWKIKNGLALRTVTKEPAKMNLTWGEAQHVARKRE